MSSENTVGRVGAKQVPLRTKGNEKMRVTVMLTARADGTKLKPFIIFKRQRPVPELAAKFPQLVIAYNANGWMDESLTAKHLSSVFNILAFRPRLLA